MTSLIYVYKEITQWLSKQGMCTRIVFWIWLVAVIILLALWVTH